MTQTGPAWFDISTPDSPRTRRFYEDMFGWRINALDETYALVDGPGDEPMGGIGQSGPDSPYTGIVVYFDVDDVDTALKRAEELGGTKRLDPVPLPNQRRLALFTDPDGNVVGLLSA
jgi:uncharacterized protein